MKKQLDKSKLETEVIKDNSMLLFSEHIPFTDRELRATLNRIGLKGVSSVKKYVTYTITDKKVIGVKKKPLTFNTDNPLEMYLKDCIESIGKRNGGFIIPSLKDIQKKR